MARHIQAGKGYAILLEEHEDPLTICIDGDIAIQPVPGGFALLVIGEGDASELQHCMSLDKAFESAIVAAHFLRNTYVGTLRRWEHYH